MEYILLTFLVFTFVFWFLCKCKEIKNLEETKKRIENAKKSLILMEEGFVERTKKRTEKLLEKIKRNESRCFDIELDIREIREKINRYKSLDKELLNIDKEREGLKLIALERQKGCPWLEDEYERLFAIKDFNFETNVERCAPVAAEKIRIANKARRTAEKNERIYKNLIGFYEAEFPFLLEYKEQIISEEDTHAFEEYTDEEKEDVLTNFLSVDEYKRLSETERNQLALDRYLSRNKTSAEIGKMYERFIGYEYERNGWDVEFKGIIDGFEDLGRDLICVKEKTCHIVQCKNWAHYKTMHEKHIFQLFGTLYLYRKKIISENKYNKVVGVFCTTTSVSQVAREAAKDLNIEIRENKQLEKDYPCIKCNIGKTGDLIYHLPFDQQYDRVKIKCKEEDSCLFPPEQLKTEECYCKTVAEAEAKGFRRAFKHHSIK